MEVIKEFSEPQSAMQMDGSSNVYKHYVSNAQISFLNTCAEFYKPTYRLEKIWVRDLNIRVDFVLGLDFLLPNNGSCLLTRDGVIFSKNTTQTAITTESIPTRSRYLKNKLNTNTSKCNKGEECTCTKIHIINKEEKIEEIELLEISLSNTHIEKSYNLIEINIELYNFKRGLQHIGIIKNQKDLDEVISILDRLEIIGERPLKHWKANHITCRLDIINPEYTVKTASVTTLKMK